MADPKHIEMLAKAAFAAWEQVRILEHANTPIEYAAREKLFVQLAEARRVAVETQMLLDARIQQG